MSLSIAQQVILHPKVTQTLKVWSTTVGRDKTYRAIQYFSRFLAYYLYRKGYTKETVARFSNLKSALGLSRKLMRIGKPMEHLQAALKAIDVSDPIVRVTAIGRQLGYALYLVHDTLAWTNGAKVYTFEKPTMERINKNAARFWFTGILFSIISSLYKTRDLYVKTLKANKPRPNVEKEQERKAELKTLQTQALAVRKQLLQDVLDICIPANTLGFLNFDDGLIGLIGTVTAIMGLQSQAQKVLGSFK